VSGTAAASLTGLTPGQVRSLLQQLSDAHLLTEHVPGRYAFHGLLRTYAMELSRRTDNEPDRLAAQQRMLDHYLHTSAAAAIRLLSWEVVSPPPPAPHVTIDPVADHRQALAWYRAERPVLLGLIALAAHTHFPIHTCQLAWTLTEYLYRQGRWHDWALVEQTALDAAVRDGGYAEQARSHRELARAYARLGRIADAEMHCRRALNLAEQLGDALGTAMTHRVFGIVCEGKGRHEEALSHDRAALKLFQRIGHDIGQARALNAIGWSHALLGDHRQALRYCRQALPLLRAAADRQGLAATWDTLGLAHHHLGQHEQAPLPGHSALGR
jgi:tetratricopeptide (TPR) repeat protein